MFGKAVSHEYEWSTLAEVAPKRPYGDGTTEARMEEGREACSDDDMVLQEGTRGNGMAGRGGQASAATFRELEHRSKRLLD